jgi:pimeloyl-ACP methyl ester carboxylesterase
MLRMTANGIQIAYETFGNPSERPLLLIIGLGGQMIHWDDDLCRDLARRGHYVIRFDNRDAGLSTKFDEAGLPNLGEVFGKMMHGEKITPAYTLDDMADDAAGLLDALGIRQAHICGMSMGGMIAQTLAIRHPSRVLSLISIYSTTGNPHIPQPKPEVIGMLIAPPPREREANIEHMLGVFKTIAGPGFPPDETWTREIMAESFDRCFHPQGMARQLVAILTQVNRAPALASVKAPALVVHGNEDPLVSVEGGKDTARAIPGAELILIEGMGHDLPHGGAWPRIVEAIAAHTGKTPSR